MASDAVFWVSHLLNVTKHPHDSGICPKRDIDGIPVVRWIEIISGQCVYGTLGSVSWSFGYLSMLSWICAQLPQIITNYQNSSVDGLSPIFLTNWFMGDITNLLGCILTSQLPFQTLLACYYVLVDAVLMFQYLFYKILFPPRPPALIPSTAAHFHGSHPLPSRLPSSSGPVKINRIVPNRDFQRSALSLAILLGFVSMVTATPVADVPDESDSIEFLGHILAWMCCSFYLTSRLPQIRENHRRRSTQGLNIALFTSALCGNMFYTAGIMTNPLAHREYTRTEFLLNALPYLLGSAGTIAFDIIILIQYFRYWGQEPVELDRDAIKRYLTTDESWVKHRWTVFRRKLKFPISISIHNGPYRGQDEVIEGVETDEHIERSIPTKIPNNEDGAKEDETKALLGKITSTRGYGT